MDRLDHPKLDVGDPLASSLVHPGDLLDAMRSAVQRELEDRDHRGAALLRERDPVVAEMIEVSVCRRDDVELSVLEALRESRVLADPGIDRDPDTLW